MRRGQSNRKGKSEPATVAYLTTFYNGDMDGRFGRFHDWVHALRDMENPPFDFKIIALSAMNPDETLSSIPYELFGDAGDLWGTPLNKPEFILNLPRAIQDLRQIEYDFIHVLTLDTIAYPLAAATGDPLVVGPDVQGYFPGRKGERWSKSGKSGLLQRSRFRLRKALRHLAPDARVVALSEYHKSNIEKLGYDSDVIKVVPPGVDSIFHSNKRTPEACDNGTCEFLYVGDLSDYKGYPLFLKALARLSTEVDWKATIVGSGTPARELVSRLGIDDRVRHEGFVPRAELPEFYRKSDFYVMPSIDENGPNTIVESLSCGTPVLATDRPGINEYGDKSCCLYFERTVEDINKTLERAVTHRESLQRQALKFSLSLSVRDTIRALESTYLQVKGQK